MRREPSTLLEVARQRSVTLDTTDRETLARIDQHGWAVMQIFQPDGTAPPFAFSVGLTYRFNSPRS